MSEHTPGPWIVHRSKQGECLLAEGHYVDAADGEGVCFAQRSREDAILISAAPELLAALEELVRTMEELDDYSAIHCDCDPSVGIDSCNYCEARAAIAKAKGEQS